MNSFFSQNKTTFVLFLMFVIGCFFLPHFFSDRIFLHQIINKYHNSFFDVLFTYATYLVDGIVLVPIILFFLLFKNINYAVQLLFLSILLLIFSQVLKHFIFDDIERPFLAFKNIGYSLRLVLPMDEMHSHNSFPSGHTTTAFSLYLYLSFTVVKKVYKKLIFFSLAMLAGLSRVYLSQHFIEDVVAGVVLGFIIAILTFWFFDKKISQKEKYNIGLISIFAK